MKKNDFINALNTIDINAEAKQKIINRFCEKSNHSLKKSTAKKLTIITVSLLLICACTIILLALNYGRTDASLNNSDNSLTDNIVNNESKTTISLDNSNTNNAESEAETSNNNGVGGYDDPCIHDSVWNSYHAVLEPLQQYVGKDVFRKWENSTNTQNVTEECPYGNLNIYNFVHQFNISKEMFCDVYYNQASNYYMGNYYSFWYDVDALYNLTEEEYSNFYKDKSTEIYSEMCSRAVECSLKGYLLDKKGFENIISSHFSIAQIIYDNNITRSEFEEAINYIKEIWKTKSMYTMFNYNLDLIYDKNQTLLDALENVKAGKLYPVQVDEMIRVSSDDSSN